MSDQPNERPGLDEWLRRTLQSLPPLSAEQVSTISRVVTEIDRARARRSAQNQHSAESAEPEPARQADGEVIAATPPADSAPTGWIRDEIDAELAMLRVAQAAGDQRQVAWHRGVLDGLVRAAAGAGVATRAGLAGYVAARLLDRSNPAAESDPGD